MYNERKKRIAFEVTVILGVMALLMLVLRMWPILLLVMLAIIICALRMVFLRLRRVEVIIPSEPIPLLSPPDTELSIAQKAFGLLQLRITEALIQQYPNVRWVWESSNAFANFREGIPVFILLNSAGGYQKAQVLTLNLMFQGLFFVTASSKSDAPVPAAEKKPANSGSVDDDDDDDTCLAESADSTDDAPYNYGRLAFDWVDANVVSLNTKYNEALAQGQSEMLIPSEELPHPDSWTDVCVELKRSGFTVADFCEDGIRVNILH